ncbi:MAG: ParB/RepB/Spo0J family partition protein [Clostridiales bacterium]|nr:ParB/RepB/Spo0J family partition protein [Clostridiales bacterium]
MQVAKELKLNLPSVDDLFSTQEERDDAQREKVMQIPLAEISGFPNHPFKVRMDDAMQEMAQSVKEYGVLVPALVRPKEGCGYEMVAGHRRKAASELAGIETIPCIVRSLTDDEATIIMVDSNLQRERILPSEKAFAYKMKLEAMRRKQGERTDLTSVPLGQKLDGKTSRELLAEKSPDSNTQIQRYIRLTELEPPILEMVDEGKIAFRPAVELSYLTPEQQQSLYESMGIVDGEPINGTPSHTQALKMRKFAEENRLNEDVILSILSEEKPNQKEQFKMPRERINKYFPPGTPAQKIEDTIIKALELYRKRQRDMER